MRVGVGVATGRYGGGTSCGGCADEEGDGTLAEVGLADACGAGVHEQMGLRRWIISLRLGGGVSALKSNVFQQLGLSGIHK